LGEPPSEVQLARSGSLLELPGSQPDDIVLTQHIKRAENGSGIIVRLYNPSDQEQTATARSGLLQLQAASRCDLFENPQEPLAVENGQVSLSVPARNLVTLCLDASLP
jgi:alpha-mannosidase